MSVFIKTFSLKKQMGDRAEKLTTSPADKTIGKIKYRWRKEIDRVRLT